MIFLIEWPFLQKSNGKSGARILACRFQEIYIAGFVNENMKSSKAFTLIEILISIFIFSLVMVVSAGIFISAFRAQRNAFEQALLFNQMSYAIEYMSRALRMAKKDLDGSCITSKMNYEISRFGAGIKFKNYKGECQEFYLEADHLKEMRAGLVADLSSDDLKINTLRFGLADSWDQEDFLQPRTTFFIEASSKQKPNLKLTLQTTISQRNLDVPR